MRITKAVFDGLEFNRRSGATNMLHRPIVLNLVKGWAFSGTAVWIKQADTRTYGGLILEGPEHIDTNPYTEVAETDSNREQPCDHRLERRHGYSILVNT